MLAQVSKGKDICFFCSFAAEMFVRLEVHTHIPEVLTNHEVYTMKFLKKKLALNMVKHGSCGFQKFTVKKIKVAAI